MAHGIDPVRRFGRSLPFDPVPLLVVIVAGVLVAYGLRVVNNWHLMTDEMLYVKLSYGVADGHLFPGWVRDQPTDLRNMLFPLLIAPLFELFSVSSAVRGAIWLNSFLMAAAAVPAYLIARELTARRSHAWLVCAMVAATPWALQSANMLTESTAYFVLVWALWGMFRCVRASGWRADAVAVVLLGVAYLGRTQFVVLAPVLPVAVVFHEVITAASARLPGSSLLRAVRTGLQRAFTTHVLLWALTVGAVFYVLVVSDPATLLGTYSVTSEGDLLPPGIWELSQRNVGAIAMGIGAIPLAFALAWAAATFWRGAEPAHQAFATIAILTVPAIAIAATSFDIRYAAGSLAERYVFYVAPVFFIGFGAYFARPRNLLWLVGGTAAAIHVVTLPAYDAPSYPYSSPASFMTPVLNGRADQVAGWIGWNPSLSTFITVAMIVSCALAYAAHWRFGSRAFVAVGLLLVLGLAGQLRYLTPRVASSLDGQPLSFLGERTQSSRDWVDRVTTEGDRVGIVDGPISWHAGQSFWDPNYRLYAWWDIEFWNKRVTSAYGVVTSGFTLQPAGYATPDYDRGSWDLTLQQEPSHLVLSSSDARLAPAGRIVATEDPFSLYELDRPTRLAWMSQGLGEDGWTDPATPAVIRVYGDPDGARRTFRLTVSVYTGADVPGGRRVTLRAGDTRVRRFVEQVTTLPIDVCVSAGGHADVQVEPQGGTPRGDRVVGARVIGAAVAPGKPC